MHLAAALATLALAAAHAHASHVNMEGLAGAVRQAIKPFRDHRIDAEEKIADWGRQGLEAIAPMKTWMDQATEKMEEVSDDVSARYHDYARGAMRAVAALNGSLIQVYGLKDMCDNSFQVNEHDDIPDEGPAVYNEVVVPEMDNSDESDEVAEMSMEDVRAMMQPTGGLEELQNKIMAEFPEDAFVSLKDLTSVVGGVAAQLRAERWADMKARMDKVRAALDDLKYSSNKASQLNGQMAKLRHVIKRLSPRRGPTPLDDIVMRLANVLQGVSCKE